MLEKPIQRSIIRKTGEIIAALLFVGVCYFVFARHITLRSHTPEEGILLIGESLPDDSVSIFRNDYGIPHIIAGSDKGAFFGIGFAHAQDRLWQMDFSRRIGQGRLSEVFGKRTLQTDIFLRHLELVPLARRLYDKSSPSSKEALEAYSAGVNAFLEQYRYHLPVEFDILRYYPEEWEPWHCFLIGRLMAWELNMSFWTDAAFGEIQATLGRERALELLPDYPDNAPTVTDEQPFIPPAAAAKSAAQAFAPSADTMEKSPEMALLFRQYLHRLEKVRSDIGLYGSSFGSNCWAIRTPKDSANPSAIIANDPHLSLGLPARWYQAHLSAPMLNVIGMTIPGLPFVLIGRNDSIGWGITNMMIDDCDFFVETLDSTGRKSYKNAAGSFRPLTIINDTILVQDSAEAVITIRKTERSALLSEVHPFTRSEGDTIATNPYLATTALSFRWTGQHITDDVLAMYRLNKAQNKERFLRAISSFSAPGLNFHYADTKGNIGVAPRGLLPRRLPGTHPNLPSSALTSGWSGYIPPDSLPSLFNPKKGFVVSANNRTSSRYRHFISHLWEPPSRSQRISELLEFYNEYSASEAQIMQVDILSPFAREITPIIIEDLTRSFSTLDSMELAVFRLLRQWDYVMDEREAAPALFNLMMKNMVKNTFEPHLGEDLYERFTFITAIPTRTLAMLLRSRTSSWFDDPKTTAVEERKDLIVKSFRAALQEGRKIFEGEELPRWEYGKMHTLTLRHPLGESVLRPLFSSPAYNVGGHHTTILNMEWTYSKPTEVRVGPSVRFVADMSDTVVSMILPGGVSGQPLSPNYANQTSIWLLGGSITLPIAPTPAFGFTRELVLKKKAD